MYKTDAFKKITNSNPNRNKNLDWSVQERILYPFTNSTNSELDFRVPKWTLCPFIYSTNLALDPRIQNVNCRLRNNHAKQSPPHKKVSAVQNGHPCAKRYFCISDISVFPQRVKTTRMKDSTSHLQNADSF